MLKYFSVLNENEKGFSIMSNFRDEYPMKNLKLEDLKDDKYLYSRNKQNIKLAKALNMSIAVFGITLAFVAVNVILNREASEAVLKSGMGQGITLVMAISLIAYAVCMIMLKVFPDKNWNCPHCGSGIPFIVPIGKKANINNKLAQIKIEQQRIAIGKVEGSFLIIPEVCPFCGKRIHSMK